MSRAGTPAPSSTTRLDAFTTHSVTLIPGAAPSVLRQVKEALLIPMREEVQCLVHHVPGNEILAQSFDNRLHCVWDDGFVQLRHRKVQGVVSQPIRSLVVPQAKNVIVIRATPREIRLSRIVSRNMMSKN